MIVGFICSACGERFSVDPGKGAKRITTGCPLCGAGVDVDIEEHVAEQNKETELAAKLAAEAKVKADAEAPVKCTVAGVPLEPETKPPPPDEGEGDKTKCPACGHEF